MSDDYCTNANADELRERIRGLEETVSQLRGEHRSAYRRWWTKNWGHVVGWPLLMFISVVSAVFIGRHLPSAVATHERTLDQDFHDAQLACMPGWIERLDSGNGRYNYEPYEDAICTDGTKRWVVKR